MEIDKILNDIPEVEEGTVFVNDRPRNREVNAKFSEIAYNVSRGAKPCGWIICPKGEMKSGYNKEEEVYLYVTTNKYYQGDDDVFIYKYPFIKTLIEFNLNLRGDMEHIINGLMFGYGLAEIEAFMKKNRYLDELEKQGKAIVVRFDEESQSTYLVAIDKSEMTKECE